MGETVRSEALALWRALALGSMALLLASVGERVLHRAPSAGARRPAAVPARAAAMPEALPPEWRWQAQAIPIERLYGATPGR
jgi:hypothetical protein